VDSLDGIVRAYDPLTSLLIRVFEDRTSNPRQSFAGMTLLDESKCKVTQIRTDRDNMVAAVGGKLITWSLVAEIAVLETKKKKRKGRGVGIKSDRVLGEFCVHPTCFHAAN
jgi:hypothetical protein